MGRKKRAPLEPRTIYVYVPTIEMAETWKKAAKKNEVSVSNFIQGIVDKHLTMEGEVTARQSIEEKLKKVEEQNRELREENTELFKKIKRLNTLLDRYEQQIKDLENEKFLTNGEYEGVRKFKENLVELFKKNENVKEEKILDLLHVNPDDKQTIKAINRQIETLLEYGLIKRYRGGYKWQR